MAPGLVPLWLPAVALASALLTAAVAAAARRGGVLDLPGRRRSHDRPTPRGGGAGPLLVWGGAVLLLALPPGAAVLGAIAAVALVGLVDDLRGLGIAPRLAVHVGAGIVLGGVLAAMAPAAQAAWWWTVAAIIAAATLNFWNFMDGIDGLMGLQTAFTAAAIAALALSVGEIGLATSAALLAAALLGFLPLNLPRARVFMGDVGSGGLGFALAALALLLAARRPGLAAALLLAFSVPLVDAGMTLGHRVLAGRRWYAPHREHLYQWLVRRGRSHGRVDLIYLSWNLLVVAPLVAIAVLRPGLAAGAALLGWAMAAAAWWFGKRALLREAAAPCPGAGR